MACQLRTPEETDPLPHAPGATRIEKLKDLICGGPWGNRDDICLIYWRPKGEGGEWVAWVDEPNPKVDPLPEAHVNIA